MCIRDSNNNIRRPSVGVSEPVLGERFTSPLPLSYRALHGHLAQTIVKHDGFGKISVLLGRRGCLRIITRNHPRGVKNANPSTKSASKTRTLSPKVRPRTPVGIKNTYPQPKSASKTRTLSPKVRPPDPGGRQTRVPSAKKCVKNTYPQPKSASKTRTLRDEIIDSG